MSFPEQFVAHLAPFGPCGIACEIRLGLVVAGRDSEVGDWQYLEIDPNTCGSEAVRYFSAAHNYEW